MDLSEFRRWYIDVLERLYPERDSGFAIMLITIPILERYIRCKLRIPRGGSIGEKGIQAICQLFPEPESTAAIKSVWECARHGLLHQLTFFSETRSNVQLPVVRLTHDILVAMRIEDDDSISIHPVYFSKRVVRAVLEDFATFSSNADDSISPLPEVLPMDPGSLTNFTKTSPYGTQSPTKHE